MDNTLSLFGDAEIVSAPRPTRPETPPASARAQEGTPPTDLFGGVPAAPARGIYLHLTYVTPHRSIGPFDDQRAAEAEAHRFGQAHHFAGFPLVDNCPPGTARKGQARKAAARKAEELRTDDDPLPLGGIPLPDAARDPALGLYLLLVCCAAERLGQRARVSDGHGGVDWRQVYRLVNGIARGVESDRPVPTADAAKRAYAGAEAYLAARREDS